MVAGPNVVSIMIGAFRRNNRGSKMAAHSTRIGSRYIMFAIAALGLAASVVPLARAQGAPLLLNQMVGTWDVTERMWPGEKSAPIVLPAATAERHLVGGAILQDTMIAIPGAGASFTRIAYLDYNTVTRRYE